MKILYFGLLLSVALCAEAHPGRTDAEGCHAGKLLRHCHDNQAGRDASRAAARKSASEDAYNRRFCAAVGGVTETRHTYIYSGGGSYVKVDCETATTVYEGGRQTSTAVWTACSRRCFSVR